MQTRYATHPDELAGLTPAGLRDRFLVGDLFAAGEVRLAYSHHDRLVVGGAVPAGASVSLSAPDQLGARCFLDRRELAVVCVGGSGTVTAGGKPYDLAAHDLLYVGRGAGEVTFAGADARYYLVSAPAHEAHPTVLVHRDDAAGTTAGDDSHANVRTIRRYVHEDGARSCQLVVGITTLAEGSVWNTMPCHTHERRTEVYLYFDLEPDARVVHLCGRPDATRSIVVANEQAVISPPWSVHCGCGTASYAFVWAMGGENTDYGDMAVVAMDVLR